MNVKTETRQKLAAFALSRALPNIAGRGRIWIKVPQLSPEAREAEDIEKP
jgi:hypothetical protein